MKEYIYKKFIKSQNRKVLLENFFYLSILQIMRYLVPILVLPYVSRIIGVTHFGQVAVTASVATILQIVVDYGYNFIGARDVAKNKKDITFISNLYSSITVARCILFFISFAIVYILSLFLSFLSEVRLLLIIHCQCVFFSIFMPEWLYQGLEDMKFITIINVISRVVYVLLIFLLIRRQEDYLYYPAVNNIGLLCAGIASFIILRNKNIRLHRVSFKNLWIILKNGWDLFINALCGGLLGNILNMFIGHYLSFKDAGIFSSSSKLTTAMNHGIDIVARVFFPYLSQHINKHNKFFVLFVSFGLFISLITFIFTPFIFHIFYPAEYNDGIVIMRILSIGIFFSTISKALSSNYLILLGKEKIVRNIGFFNLVLGTISFLIAIKFSGLMGVAIASVGLSIINCTLFSYFSIKVKKELKAI